MRKKVTLYERYSDENAFKNHLSRILEDGGDLQEEFGNFSNIYTFEGIIYLGDVSNELRSYIKDHGLGSRFPLEYWRIYLDIKKPIK